MARDSGSLTLDIGVGEVHVPVAGRYRTGPPTEPKDITMAEISGKERKALRASKFAIPSKRAYPIHDAAHVRNAAARLEQEKKAGKIGGAEYASAKRRIASAAKKLGVESEYNTPKRRLRFSASLPHGGELTVRHLSATEIPGEYVTTLTQAYDAAKKASAATGDEALTLRQNADKLLADAKQPVWIQVAKQGHFVKDPLGAFDLNENVFREVIKNFEADANRRIPVDFEHATEQPPTAGSIPMIGAPAQGWITSLAIRNGDLWGLVQWGDLARDYIREGKYRYFSPALRLRSKDRVTGAPAGARMTSGALTNVPFLSGMQPLAAKDTAEDVIQMQDLSDFAHHPNEYMPKLKASLKLPELATAKELSDHVDRLRDHLEAAGGNAGAMHEGVRLADYLHPLRDAVGASPGTTWEQVFDVVQDLIDAAIEQHVIEDHGGDAEEPNMTADDADGDTTMADEKALKDATDKLSETTIALKDAQTHGAELKLQLKDVTAERDTLKTENESLKAAKAKADELALTSRVEEAFDSYKDAKKLTADDKDAMSLVLRADASKFEKLYPRITADKRHLMQNFTDRRPNGAPIVREGGSGKVGPAMSRRTLAKQIMSQRGISFEDALALAARAIARRPTA